MNQITYQGKTVNIGPTPNIIERCGFRGPAEVRRVAARCSRGEPVMQMGDVVEHFRAYYHQPNV